MATGPRRTPRCGPSARVAAPPDRLIPVEMPPLTRRPLLLALAGLPAACGLPRDPEGTSARVEGGALRVGAVPRPPWIDPTDTGVGGLEAELVRGFARELRAEVDWRPGSESAVLPALEQFELDLVVGGLVQDTPWRDRIGPSRPYLTVRTVLGIPPGEPAPGSLEGLRVLVRRGDPAAARLRARGALPAEVERVAPGQAMPAAVEDWRLPALSLRDAGMTLWRERHVMAVAPGENGFLLRLERYLLPRAAAIAERLRDMAA